MDNSHPKWRMGAVIILGGIWEIIFSVPLSRACERRTTAGPGARSGWNDRSLDNCLVVLEQPRQDTKVDHAADRLVDNIDDLGDGMVVTPKGRWPKDAS